MQLLQVLSGLRRSGKSSLFEIYHDILLKMGIGKKQMQFLNFELPDNYLNKRWSDISFEIKKKMQPNKTNYVFLDEVQNIPFFEKLVDGLFATENTDIYITGSNAFLLSSELATLLSGRYIEICILPFSIKEYHLQSATQKNFLAIELLKNLHLSSIWLQRFLKYAKLNLKRCSQLRVKVWSKF